MESTFENNTGTIKGSANTFWQQLRSVLAAGSLADAGRSAKRMLEATPFWLLAVIIVGGIMLIANASLLVYPLAIGGALGGVYFTVKRAVAAALREHDAD